MEELLKIIQQDPELWEMVEQLKHQDEDPMEFFTNVANMFAVEFEELHRTDLRDKLSALFGGLPKKIKLLNCVGGGSSAMGFWNEFMDTDAEFIGIEAGGPKKSKLHAAPLTNGSKIGILHGSAQYVIQNSEGQIGRTESISAGLDYPGISSLHCFLKDSKRAKYTSASDEEALKAYQLVSKFENISPSLEPSHAFAEAIKLAPKLKSSEVIIVNSCGDSLKDKDIIKQKLGSYVR